MGRVPAGLGLGLGSASAPFRCPGSRAPCLKPSCALLISLLAHLGLIGGGALPLAMGALCFPLPVADSTDLAIGEQGATWGSPPEHPHLVHPHYVQSPGPSTWGGRLGGAGLVG